MKKEIEMDKLNALLE